MVITIVCRWTVLEGYIPVALIVETLNVLMCVASGWGWRDVSLRLETGRLWNDVSSTFKTVSHKHVHNSTVQSRKCSAQQNQCKYLAVIKLIYVCLCIYIHTHTNKLSLYMMTCSFLKAFIS